VVIEKREMSIFILLIINNGSRAESWTGKKQGALPARDELSGSLAWSVQKTYPGTFVPCTRTEPAGADARMIIKQAASGIPVFLLLFSLNRIQDRGPFTRSRSHALKSIGHSVATAVGPNLSADYYSKNQLIGPTMVRHCLAQSRHALAQSSIPSSLSQLSAHASQISAHILQT